ncbi:MAG: 30S ribosomal protein S8 [Proteobacteria bacterium]|nr:30S ribosomal protein S8 [Pseudomonadota bacterium]
MTDPISVMLTRIRNGGRARLEHVSVPASRTKREVARVLEECGYITSYSLAETAGKPAIVVELRYTDGKTPIIEGIERVSKPSRRVYVNAKELPRVRNGLGVAILSTPRGLMSDEQAREAGVGGEYLARVW